MKNIDRRQMESPAASLSASTDSTANETTSIQLDLLVFAVGSRFSCWKLDVIGLVLGWAQTRPGPTRGHPYNQLSALINLGNYNSYQRAIPIKR